MKDFIVVKEGAEGIYEEKKSRFIAKVYKTDNESEAGSYIEEARKKYWDARHNCYAYIIGDKGQIQRFSDDGEPQGTAGKPILDIIAATELVNCLIIVTRYFGGVLLGTGGLIRAYQASAKAGLDSSDVSAVCTGIKANITADYNSYGKLQYICNEQGVDVLNTGFGADVDMELVVKAETAGAFEKKITDAFSGNITLENKKNVNFCKKNSGEIIFL